MPTKRRREGSGGSGGGGGGGGGAGAGVGGGAGGRGGRRPTQPPPPPPRAPALKRRCRSFDLSVAFLFYNIFFLLPVTKYLFFSNILSWLLLYLFTFNLDPNTLQCFFSVCRTISYMQGGILSQFGMCVYFAVRLGAAGTSRNSPRGWRRWRLPLAG